MKSILLFLILMFNFDMSGQTVLTGTGKIKAKFAEIEVGGESTKIKLTQRENNNYFAVKHQNIMYSFHKANGFVLKDSLGNKLAIISKNGKTLQIVNGENYKFKKCRRWSTCLYDKDNVVLARAKYKSSLSKITFEIVINDFDPVVTSMIILKLILIKRQNDEDANAFFIMTS